VHALHERYFSLTVVEENPVGPKKLLATTVAFFFSLFAGIVLVLILEKVRRDSKNLSDSG